MDRLVLNNEFCHKSVSWPQFVMFSSDAIAVKQSQVDKLYASLKDLALERRDKLGEILKLYKLNREIEDLEQWISEREVVAGSHELGQDFEHVTVRTYFGHLFQVLNLPMQIFVRCYLVKMSWRFYVKKTRIELNLNLLLRYRGRQVKLKAI